MPTVRRLARELSVAPNTIVKAYSELQRVGLVESRPGVGTVAEGVEEVASGGSRRFERSRVLVRDAVALEHKRGRPLGQPRPGVRAHTSRCGRRTDGAGIK